MPVLETSQEWLTQSSLLLQARPSSTRITTKYNIMHPDKVANSRKRKVADDELAKLDAVAGPRATLTLKTFDPASGTVLKYSTDKQAEVGRLIASLGTLGRHMAALPEIAEDTLTADAPIEQDSTVPTPVQKPTTKDAKTTTPESKGGQASSGGKKKKKGKK